MFNIIWSKAKILKLKNYLKQTKFTTLFSLSIQLPWVNSNFNIGFVSFLLSFSKKIGPNDAFVKICLCRLNRNIFQTFAHFFICCIILTWFGKKHDQTKFTKNFPLNQEIHNSQLISLVIALRLDPSFLS